MGGGLIGYHLLPGVRGDLLAKLGRFDEARMEFARIDFPQERIEDPEKAGERLPAPGWRCQQNRLVFENRGNAEQLGLGEIAVGSAEPLREPRMQSLLQCD